MPDARIYVKIDVDNAAAIAKIRATEASIASITKKNEDLGKRIDALAKSHLTEMKALEQKGKLLDQHSHAVLKAASASRVFEAAGGALMKVVKFGAMEFGGMTAVLGGLKAALLAGQYVMKGFHVGMLALGAAAGVAIGAISGVLGAMRELQTAKLSPEFKAVYGLTPPGSGPDATRYRSSRGLINRTMGDSRFGMFSDAGLQTAMSQQLQHGQQVGGGFRNQLARLGDFAGGDEKKLLALNNAMAQAAEAGKITQTVYDELVKASPALGKAFEEMTGGPKQAAAAAAKGSISFAEFNKVLMEGNLKALQPYNGALNEINNTVMGKFKGAIRSIKEQLVSVSETSANALYGSGTNKSIMDAIKEPIDQIVNSVKATINAITPMIQQMVPGIFGGAGDLAHHLTDSITMGIGRGMEWMQGFSVRMNGWIGNIRAFFGTVADYLTKASAPFDILWKNVLVPLGGFIVGTLNTAIKSFGSSVDQNRSALEQWGRVLKGAQSFVKILFGALNGMKAVFSPLTQMLGKIIEPIEKLAGTAIGGFIGKFLAGSVLLFGATKKITSSFMKWKNGLAESFGTMEKTKSEFQALTESVELLTKALKEALALQEQIGITGVGPTGKGGGSKSAMLGTGMPGQMSLFPVGSPTGGRGGGGGNAEQMSLFPMTPLAPGGGPTAYPPITNMWQRWKYRMGIGEYGQKAADYRAENTLVTAATTKNESMMLESGQAANKAEQKLRGYGLAGLAMAGTMAGGMMGSSNNHSVSALGNAVSGLSMGAYMGTMLPAGLLNGIEGRGVFGENGAFGENGGAAAGALVMGGNMLGNAIKNTNAAGTANQMVGGALQGASTGAALGGLIGPEGAAIGAVAGGAIGATQGWFNAKHAQEKLAKEAEKQAREKFTSGNLNSLENIQGARAGNRKALEDVRKGSEKLRALGYHDAFRNTGIIGKKETAFNLLTPEEQKSAQGIKLQHDIERLKSERKGLEEWARNSEEQIKGYNKAFKLLNEATSRVKSNIKTGEFFGFNAKDIAGYADRHNIKLNKIQLGVKAMIDMTGYSMKASDAMANLALSAKRTYEWLTDAYKAPRESAQASIDARKQIADFLANSNQPMDKDARFLAGTDAMTSLASQGTAFLAAGGYGRGKEAFSAFRNDQTAKIYRLIQEVNSRPGVQSDMAQMMQMLGVEAINKLNGGFKFSDAAQMDPSISENLKGIATGAATSIIQQGQNAKASGKNKKELIDLQQAGIKERALAMAQWAKNEYHLSDNVNTLAADMAKLIGGTIQEQGGTLYDKTVKSFADGGALAAQQMINAFTSVSLVLDDDGKGFHWKKGAADRPQLSAQQRVLVASGTQNAGAEMQITPDLLAAAGYGPPPADSNGGGIPNDTPSSRFARTLVAHSMFNSMVPGRRLMTSGLRNYNLGSLSSDHRIGAAYDLTGDNLGSYAKLVNASGGFAEFHGAAGSRHLHVVPPHGDSASPAMVGGYGGVHNHSYSIVVNGGDASPAAIADEVMARIQRVQRNAVERY